MKMIDTSTSEDLFFSELLKHFRKRKKLTQKQLAERIEVSRETVSFWERGQFKPDAEGILYQIVDVLALTVQEQHQLFNAYTVTALATSFHNPPLKRNQYFTGRRSQLNQLHTLLMAGKQVALTQAISGLGGIGKTQLALEYAYQYQKSYHDIFWVNADTEESLMASYVLFAGMLHLPEYEEADQNKLKVAVQHWLRKHTGWLLIFDNMEDLNLLQQFVPVDRQGSILLTTRRQVTEPVAQALELEVLPENDAILFLLKRTKVLPVNRSLEDASDHDIEAARAITYLLGNLPLALDQAGAYILETPCSFAEYLTLFQTYQSQLRGRFIIQ
jgi:DNA-binding XRE family transcriptional regulator